MTPHTPRTLCSLLGSSLLFISLAFPAVATEVVMLEDTASPCAIMRALSPQVGAQCPPLRPRSVVLLPAKAAAVVPVATAPVTTPAAAAQPVASRTDGTAAPRVYAFATRIQFALDSARLAPEAYPLLEALAQVLKDPAMAGKVIRIEGHTDSAGSAAYNQRLSAQRAASVQRYLHTVHGVPLAQIPAVGKGKTELNDPSRPFDGVNRRVQFVNLTDSPGRS